MRTRERVVPYLDTGLLDPVDGVPFKAPQIYWHVDRDTINHYKKCQTTRSRAGENGVQDEPLGAGIA